MLGGVTGYNSKRNRRFYNLSDAVSFYNGHTQQWTSSTKLPKPLSHIQAIYKNRSLWVLSAVHSISGPVRREPGMFHKTYLYLTNLFEYNVTQQTWINHHEGADVGIPWSDVFLFSI